MFYITFFVYIKHDFIKQDTVEHREYQVNIADSSKSSNSLVVLPTGLGKTMIALMLIANNLNKSNERILFLAPTKPLVTQHAKFLKDFLLINEDLINVFTGEVSPEKRKNIWKKSKIIVSTPQVIENDLLSKRINLSEICLVIFDECHHAIGEYSYVFVSEMYQKQRDKRLVLGMTASPGNDLSKILEVCKNLEIINIEIRTKYDHDVKPYVHNLKINWKEIPLPNEFSYTIQLLRKSLSYRLKKLKEVGVIDSSSISLINKTKILDAQKKIQGMIRSQTKPSRMLFKAASIQSEALKIHYGLELLQTQGVNALKNYFQRMGKEALSKDSSKASRSIMSDANILEAVAYAKSLKIEHPKINEIIKIVKDQLKNKNDSRIIIFTHYRDTASYISKLLKEIDIAKPARFVGQATKGEEKGLTQRQQANVIQKFKDGEFNILIATSVAEEGLDIPSTDLVVFYEPIPSEIRAIQRRGRTARKMAGKVIILITKGTPDEGYYWASKRKEKRMKNELEVLRSNLKKNINDRQDIYDKNVKFISNQKTLKEFQMKDKSIKIIADHREYRSSVVRNLTIKDVLVEPKQLDVGDYVISSRIGVERKNVDDFLESLITGKLFKQTSRLREAYSRPIIIIEGDDLLNRRNISHKAIFGSIVSIIVDFGIPVITTKNAIDTADLLLVMANREQRDGKKDIALRGEKTSMSNRERQQFVIEGFPNVSAVIAKRLLDHFTSIKDIVNASEEELQDVSGVGKNIASDIYHLLNSKYLEE